MTPLNIILLSLIVAACFFILIFIFELYSASKFKLPFFHRGIKLSEKILELGRAEYSVLKDVPIEGKAWRFLFTEKAEVYCVPRSRSYRKREHDDFAFTFPVYGKLIEGRRLQVALRASFCLLALVVSITLIFVLLAIERFLNHEPDVIIVLSCLGILIWIVMVIGVFTLSKAQAHDLTEELRDIRNTFHDGWVKEESDLDNEWLW